MPKRTINGFELHYEDFGSGPAIVLVHGFPLDGRVWLGVAKVLAGSLRVIIPDLRGFGRSRDVAPFSLESLGDDLMSLMQSLGISKFALAGLSMGGYVAQGFAKKYPLALSALILTDTKADADNAQQKQGRDDMISLVGEKGTGAVAAKMFPNMLAPSTPANRPSVAAELRAIMESIDPGTVERALLAMRERDDFVALLPTLRIPLLIIVGEHDAISPPEIAKSIHTSVAGSTLTTIADAGHMAPIEQPLRVAEAISAFLK